MRKRRISISNTAGFYLDKWFMDLVTDDGRCVICYVADFNWKGVLIPFSSIMDKKNGAKTRYRTRYVANNQPKIAGKSIHWEDKRLKISGQWTSLQTDIEEKLFKNDYGSLDWHCLHPASKVTLRIDNQDLTGFGYVERLKLSFEPWLMPMEKLIWGRFVSAEHSIVWIQVEGKKIQKWAWYNGTKIPDFQIREGRIVDENDSFMLKFGKDQVIESEKKFKNIAKSLVRYIPGVRSFVPLKYLNAQEEKMINKAELIYENQKIEGFVIHEQVLFNN